MLLINIIFAVIFAIRLYTLSISIRNEKKLIAQGAVQYGKTNSMLLSLAHILFYCGSITEANQNQIGVDQTAIYGLIILALAFIALFYVIHTLKEIWTVKLYILPQHKINNSFLFKYIRHPNYYLNIIPELIGLSLFCHAKYTTMVGLPVYLVILFIRIRQEEQAMAHLRYTLR